MESSGGGGFGEPLERDPALVAQDVAEGYVTREAATATYGVVWTGGAIDPPATAARRATLLAARARVQVRGAGDLQDGGERAIRIDQQTAEALGVGVGAIVELVNAQGAPLRAWVTAVLPGNGHRAEVATPALRILGASEGSEVEVRAVHSGVLGLPVS
jgi:N-methylhydantoinase B